jgi:MoaA/NifB/PqqE/SkfB family radical SAM enzyme
MKLHIETTTRCILACPACARTIWNDILKKPVDKADLDVDSLEKFLECDTGKTIDTFILCGDYGDPIYYPDLFKLIKRFRDRVCFIIITNGSRQTEKFWNTLSELLTEKDTVVFSIDGLEDTNHLYRVNSDWASIMMGLDIMVKSSAQVHWKTIIFGFNYNKLAEIKKFATDKGATWHAEKTHRYGNDELKPPTEQYIEINHVFQSQFINNHQIEIEPRCEKDAMVISASGYLFPCDWIRNPRTLYKSQLWKQKSRWLDKLHIKDTTYDQAVLVVRDWENYVRQNSLTGSDNVDVLCKMLCRKDCVSNNRVEIDS